MKPPNELKNDWKQYTREYIKNVEKYQQQCKHNNVTEEWLTIHDDLHGNDTGWRVKQCMDCWLILQEKERNGAIKDYRTSKLKYKDYWKWCLERFTRNDDVTEIDNTNDDLIKWSDKSAKK